MFNRPNIFSGFLRSVRQSVRNIFTRGIPQPGQPQPSPLTPVDDDEATLLRQETQQYLRNNPLADQTTVHGRFVHEQLIGRIGQTFVAPTEMQTADIVLLGRDGQRLQMQFRGRYGQMLTEDQIEQRILKRLWDLYGTPQFTTNLRPTEWLRQAQIVIQSYRTQFLRV